MTYVFSAAAFVAKPLMVIRIFTSCHHCPARLVRLEVDYEGFRFVRAGV
jgi:hypothetical protein